MAAKPRRKKSRKRRSEKTSAPTRVTSPARPAPSRSANEPSLAREYLQQGRTGEAERLCRQALAVDPRQPQALHVLGLIRHGSGQPETAVALLEEAIAIDDGNAELATQLAQMLGTAGRLRESADLFERAVKLDAGSAEAAMGLGIALQQLGQVEAAVAAYESALALEPRRAEAMSNLASALKALERFDEAIALYQRCVALAPGETAMRCQLGRILLERGRISEAHDAYRAAVELDPGYLRAYSPLVFTAMRAGDAAGALAAAKRFIERAPALHQAKVAMSCASLANGDYRRAHDMARLALEARPGERNCLANLAIAATELGDCESARYLLDFDRFVYTRKLDAPPGFESLQAFNRALVEHIATHPTLKFDIDSLSCHLGRTSDELLIEPMGPVAALEDMIRTAAEGYLRALPSDPSHPFVASRPVGWTLSAWATILESQGHQGSHIHPTAWLSGVYYVSLPASITASDSEQAGWIEHGRPPPHYLCKRDHDVRLLRPEPGRIVLFPSYFYHRTVPFQGLESRISVAFDFRPTPPNQ